MSPPPSDSEPLLTMVVSLDNRNEAGDATVSMTIEKPISLEDL
jgi:hypothetical protein